MKLSGFFLSFARLTISLFDLQMPKMALNNLKKKKKIKAKLTVHP